MFLKLESISYFFARLPISQAGAGILRAECRRFQGDIPQPSS